MQRNLDANFLGDCDVTSRFESPGYGDVDCSIFLSHDTGPFLIQ